jgi:putative ABC transport system permease protein
MQVAVTLVLLIAAGLCLRSFSRLNQQDLGFVSRHLLTFSISGLDKERYTAREARQAAIEELIARFDNVPQVTRAAALLLRPFEHGPIGMDSGVLLEGQPDTSASSSTNPVANWEWITDGYFETMRIPVIRGRTFNATDTASAPSVAVVSAATAARLWPGQDPIAKRLRLSASEDRWHTVVGVVGTARYRELDAPRFDVYVSLRQSDPDGPHFVVRTAGDPMAVIPALKARIADVDKGLTIASVITMDAIVRRVQGPWRFNMLVFGLFGGVAMGLAAVGLFALVACDVAQRRREIGLRMALGARPGQVVRLMIWEGGKPSALGVAAGLLIAFAATRALAQFLFDVTPTDPLTFAGVVTVFAVVIVVASYLPARRAAAIDPQVVLRE